jgi:hypothetical protein
MLNTSAKTLDPKVLKLFDDHPQLLAVLQGITASQTGETSTQVDGELDEDGEGGEDGEGNKDGENVVGSGSEDDESGDEYGLVLDKESSGKAWVTLMSNPKGQKYGAPSKVYTGE